MANKFSVPAAMAPPKANSTVAPSSRYPVTNDTQWDVRLTVDRDAYSGTVHNLSTTGIGIVLAEAPVTGRDAVVELIGPNDRVGLRHDVRRGSHHATVNRRLPGRLRVSRPGAVSPGTCSRRLSVLGSHLAHRWALCNCET